MADPAMQALITKVNRLEAALAAQQRSPRRHRTGRHLLPTVIVAVLVALVPLAVLADFAFLDLDPASPHNDNITAIKAAGITKGCNPPDYTFYCPKDGVTREEMASFIARAAGLGSNPPVANAKTAQTATNAATLGGRGASEFLRVAFKESPSFTNLASYPLVPYMNAAGLDVATLTLTVPGAGFVLVLGTSEPFTDTLDGCPCSVYARVFDRSAVDPAAPSRYADNILPNKPSGLIAVAPLNNVYVFTVGQAGVRTYALNVNRIDTGAATIRASGALSAVFIPFGSTGGSTLDLP